MHALDYIQSLTGIDRAKIAIEAGFSPSYIARMLSTRAKSNHCPLSLAVSACKHSGGAVDIIGSVREDGTDWSFLKTYLRKNV
jgi:hypothetical protein